jgi:hypothetical protein
VHSDSWAPLWLGLGLHFDLCVGYVVLVSVCATLGVMTQLVRQN